MKCYFICFDVNLKRVKRIMWHKRVCGPHVVKKVCAAAQKRVGMWGHPGFLRLLSFNCSLDSVYASLSPVFPSFLRY